LIGCVLEEALSHRTFKHGSEVVIGSQVHFVEAAALRDDLVEHLLVEIPAVDRLLCQVLVELFPSCLVLPQTLNVPLLFFVRLALVNREVLAVIMNDGISSRAVFQVRVHILLTDGSLQALVPRSDALGGLR